MNDATARELADVRRQLTEAAEQLGRLTVTHDRLRADHQRLSPEPAADDEVVEIDADLPVSRDDQHATATLDERDRTAYVEAIRQRLYRVLYALDFTLVHGTIDRLMLGDARQAAIDGIDSADACLMLDTS